MIVSLIMACVIPFLNQTCYNIPNIERRYIMARKAKGFEVLDMAKAIVKTTDVADDLRVCQAVILPLEYGLSTAETAAVIGRSIRWTTYVRNRFIKAKGLGDKPERGGRHQANLTKEEEREFLAPFFEKAKSGGILVVNDIYKALKERLGRHVALASAYNLLHRNGWRKLAPDKRNIASDAKAQENWKKNFQS
jgi:transposase